MKDCIHDTSPYLRPLLKLDNLPLISNHVSENVLQGEATVEDRIHTSARKAGLGVVK